MAAITGTYGRVRYQSMSFRVTLGSSGDTVSNTDLLTTSTLTTLSPSSALKTFLSTTFADTTGAEAGWRAIGGEIVVRQISGTFTNVIGVAWGASSSAPFLNITNGIDQILEIIVRVPHSIVQ